MKHLSFKVPQRKINEFVIYVDSLDAKIISQYAQETLFGDMDIYCIVKTTKDSEIPETLQEEKLKEKYSKYLNGE